MDQYFNQMEKIVKERKTSSRIRFMLQDVIDLRLVSQVSLSPHHDRDHLGRGGFFQFTVLHNSLWSKDGRAGAEAGSEEEALEELCLLACSLSFFFYPAEGTDHMPAVSLGGGTISIEGLLLSNSSLCQGGKKGCCGEIT